MESTGGPKPPEKSSGIEIVSLDKGDNIIMPVNGAKIFTLIDRSASYSEPKFSGVLLKYKGPDGSDYALKIESGSQITPTEILNDAPYIIKTENNVYVQTSKEGKVVPLGTPILKVTEDNASIKMISEPEKENPTVNPDIKLSIGPSGKIISLGK